MARTVIFYGTLYIAAFMLAMDTGIKRSPELLSTFSFIKGKLWGFSPLVLLLIFAGLSIYQFFFPTDVRLIQIQQQSKEIANLKEGNGQLTEQLRNAKGQI